MKHAILFIALLGISAYAEIPDTLKDPATREVAEYMDGKINKLQKDVAAISSAIPSTSTTLGIANGGTGATTAAGARGNLGVPGNDGTGAIGTWGISITGSAGSANTALTASSATYAPNYLPLAGGTMTGQINMSGSSIAFTGGNIQNVNEVGFNTSYTNGSEEGKLYYDSNHGFLTYGLPGSDINLNIGDEMILKAKNETGSLIPNGSVVYQTGVSGHRPTIALASNTNTDKILGVTTEDIDHNHSGGVTYLGEVHDINTAYAGTHEADIYVSTQAGQFTSTIPSTGNIIRVGKIEYLNNSSGVIRLGIVNAQNTIRASSATFSGWLSSGGNALIVSGGKVGVGVSSPTYPLDVAGDLNISGTFKVNGTPISGTGDAVLSANQTFTGLNTFSSTTTFSGAVVASTIAFTGGGSQVKAANIVFSTSPVIYSGNAPTSFTDLNVSGFVGTNSALVGIKLVNGGAAANCRFRKNGYTEDIGYTAASVAGGGTTAATIATNRAVMLFVQTDTSGVIEWACDASSSMTLTADFWLSN